MRTTTRYALLPALAPTSIVALYFTPTTLIGCAHRGILALVVALLSALMSIALSSRALWLRRSGAPDSHWLIVSAVILALPALLLVGPLG